MVQINKQNRQRRNWKPVIGIGSILLLVIVLELVVNSDSNDDLLSSAKYTSSLDSSTTSITTRTKAVKQNSVSCKKDKYDLAYNQSYGFFDDINEEHWKLLQKLAVEHENHKYPEAPLTHNPTFDKRTSKYFSSHAAWYQSNYEPNFSCQFEKRVGQNMNGDGPKWICDPHRIKNIAKRRKALDPNHPGCVVYSIGSNGDFNFELGMQKEVGEGVCEFHIFDMGDYQSIVPAELKRAHYHQWGLTVQDPNVDKPVPGQQFYGLLDIIKLLGHEKLDVIDIFKIDCEKCEWKTYQDWIAAGIPLLHQIQVELHNAPGQKAIDFFDTFERAGYLRFHKEANIQFSDGECIEYAFVKVEEKFLEGKKFPAAPALAKSERKE